MSKLRRAADSQQTTSAEEYVNTGSRPKTFSVASSLLKFLFSATSRPTSGCNSNSNVTNKAKSGPLQYSFYVASARVPSPGSEGRLIPCLLPRRGAKAVTCNCNQASRQAGLTSKSTLSFHLSFSIALITGDYRFFSLLQTTVNHLVVYLLGYENAILCSSSLFVLLSGPIFPNPPTSYTKYLNKIKINLSLSPSHLAPFTRSKRNETQRIIATG